LRQDRPRYGIPRITPAEIEAAVKYDLEYLDRAREKEMQQDRISEQAIEPEGQGASWSRHML